MITRTNFIDTDKLLSHAFKVQMNNFIFSNCYRRVLPEEAVSKSKLNSFYWLLYTTVRRSWLAERDWSESGNAGTHASVSNVCNVGRDRLEYKTQLLIWTTFSFFFLFCSTLYIYKHIIKYVCIFIHKFIQQRKLLDRFSPAVIVGVFPPRPFCSKT